MKKKKIIKTIPDKITKRYFQVYDCIFQQKIHVLMNFTEKDYEKWLNKNKVEDVEIKDFNNFAGWVSNFETQKGTTERILFIPQFEWTIKQQGTLIHEIVHVIIKVWDANNIPFNADTQEFLAHSIANLYEDIVRKLLVKVK
jgi:hypothetical protein